MAAAAQIPNVYLMTVFAGQEQVRLHSVLDHVRRAPFAGQQRVEAQVPPKIVLKKL